MRNWDIEQAFEGSQECDSLLTRGWEPFDAVAGDSGYVKVLFRRNRNEIRWFDAEGHQVDPKAGS